MAVKVFLTGVTGYIGGDAFYALAEAHPDWQYSILVRSQERAKLITDAYPSVRIVIGSLDDAEILEKEAADADIVLHTADADGAPAAQAISKGLTAGHSADRPGFWIHVSGTGILTWYDAYNKRYGEAPLPDQKYRDVDDIEKITSLPDHAPHRDVDKIVLATNSESVRTAIVAPSTIYGPGRGPANKESQQVPLIVKDTLKNGFAPLIAPGLVEWDHVHVHDLSALFRQLAEATQDSSKSANPEIFGPKGYFVVATDTHKWADVASWVADEAHKQGLVETASVKKVNISDVASPEDGQRYTWAQNSKGVSQRGSKFLGWSPKEGSLKEDIPRLVRSLASK